MQESPQAFPFEQILQHDFAGGTVSGSIVGVMTGAETLVGVGVGTTLGLGAGAGLA